MYTTRPLDVAQTSTCGCHAYKSRTRSCNRHDGLGTRPGLFSVEHYFSRYFAATASRFQHFGARLESLSLTKLNSFVLPSWCHLRLDGVIPSRLACTGKRKEQAHPRQLRLSARLGQPNFNTGESISFHPTSPESQQQDAGSQTEKSGHCWQQGRR